MPDSTLDLELSTPPVTGKGHGTRALGPSDTSDSGSDLQGPGIYESDADVLGLDTEPMKMPRTASAPGATLKTPTSTATAMLAAPASALARDATPMLRPVATLLPIG